jgi:hypothetical protein
LKISIFYAVIFFKQRIWSKNTVFYVRDKLDGEQIHFLPYENLVQILPESGSGSALDLDPHWIRIRICLKFLIRIRIRILSMRIRNTGYRAPICVNLT